MTRLLLFVKQKLPFIWVAIEWVNGLLFQILHGRRFDSESARSLEEFELKGYEFRRILESDLQKLYRLLERQDAERLTYFKPHDFDRRGLHRVYRNPAFLMFGVFSGSELVGYFSLRCFWNRRAFVGRLIDESFEGRGIGRVMNSILYNSTWRSGFRCHTTISKKNAMVMRSHANDPNARILRELPNDYLFIEFVEPTNDQVSGDGAIRGKRVD